ncbi:hypothetical protein CcI49_14365 [Frankia sp. CcI49]|uniref:hypothetical protein n=1 Tax=Frankia sp. CcI49 TaxID=1745382 RepID=UPI000978CDE7|nr:hypothetical protein [Frankia sp. CcI49]ONH59901.1 hypothetical protein CcI49_14365 [Frankia sp. CcI49]
MQWITIAVPPFDTVEQADAVFAQVGVEPAGLRARYVGAGPDGRLRVVALWESKAHADDFFATTLGPALARALGPEPAGRPEIIGIDVARAYVSQPIA